MRTVFCAKKKDGNGGRDSAQMHAAEYAKHGVTTVVTEDEDYAYVSIGDSSPLLSTLQKGKLK